MVQWITGGIFCIKKRSACSTIAEYWGRHSKCWNLSDKRVYSLFLFDKISIFVYISLNNFRYIMPRFNEHICKRKCKRMYEEMYIKVYLQWLGYNIVAQSSNCFKFNTHAMQLLEIYMVCLKRGWRGRVLCIHVCS